MRQTELVTRARKEIAKEETSINAQLLTRAGYIDRLMAGAYSFLPLGVRVLANIERIIREEMAAIGSQEVLMPALHPAENWRRTGRWDEVDILFKLKGAGDRDLCLGPTHEEVVTPLLQTFIRSYRHLPTSVFQIQTKFRNEPRAKSGLLRGREFRMKDMYSFHADEADLDAYYERALQAYRTIFARVGLGACTYLTYASGGSFSKYSHEFQTLTPHGEDQVYLCGACRVAVNKEILKDLGAKCPCCGSPDLAPRQSIEVGNIFKLGTRFADAFGFTYQSEHSSGVRVYMGCYGIGSSRLLGAVVEVCHDEKGIIWPEAVAPFKVHLISLFKDRAAASAAEDLYQRLCAAGIDVLYDDRYSVSAGEKFAESDLIGIPLRVVVSPRTLQSGSIECKQRGAAEVRLVPIDECIAQAALK